MSIEQTITDRMKAAMRARDKQTVNLMRMLKSKMTETTTAKGFAGEVDDALWLSVIRSYVKQQQKAIEQFEQAGEAGLEHIAEINFEIEALDEFMPKVADDATLQGWIDEAIAGAGGKENAKFGAVMGALMKGHKDAVDPAKARALINAALA